MVRDEKVLLPVWSKYYKRHFKNVHVIDHNLKHQGKMDYLKYRVKTISEYQKKLLKSFDWVVFVDVDEFLIADPDKYTGLADFIEQASGSHIYCTGREVLQERKEGPIDWQKPILAQRTTWWPHIACFKPALSQIELDYANGFHYAKRDHADCKHKNIGFKEHVLKIANPDIMLVHLKQIDRDLLRIRARAKVTAQNKEVIHEKWRRAL